ncbi:MAG: hypothetical protein HOZ81_06960 [Streptomyces sp.]|nr:hypothetical protein [Streptomyces sp.]
MNHFDSLNDLHLSLARGVHEELAAAHDLAFTVVSGSLAFGLGHGTSDIDLYAMTADGTPLDYRVRAGGSVPVQVNAVTPESLALAVRWAASDADYTAGDRSTFTVQENIRKLAIRLNGGVVLHADDRHRALLGSLSGDVIRRRVVAGEGVVVGSYLEDVSGAVASDDLDTAFLSARLALTHACEAILAATGDLYVGPKFLTRRLRRNTYLDKLLDPILEGLDLVPYRSPAGESVEERCRARAALASYLCAKASLDGWEFPLMEIEPFEQGREGPRRDPFFTLLRFGDGIGLAGPDKGFKVSPDAARLWLGLDGTRSSRSVTDEAVANGIKKLIAAGAAHEEERP